jgi:hypothetical protein
MRGQMTQIMDRRVGGNTRSCTTIALSDSLILFDRSEFQVPASCRNSPRACQERSFSGYDR